MSSKPDHVEVPCPKCGASSVKIIEAGPISDHGGQRKEFLLECLECGYFFKKEIGPTPDAEK